MQQTQRHVELLWLWASHLCYIKYLEGHLRALDGVDPSWNSRNHWAGGKHSCQHIPGTIWVPCRRSLGQQSVECPIYVSWQEKGKSFSLHFFFACLCISFGRIESSGAQTCDIYPYLAILPLRIEKSGTHMMRRPLTLLPSWSYPLQRVGKSRCPNQRWRARGMSMFLALLLVLENICSTFVRRMWKLWIFARSTLPWPGERWHPSHRSSEMRIWVAWSCPLSSHLASGTDVGVPLSGSLWRHVDRRASRWIRWDMMRYFSTCISNWCRMSMQYHAIMQFLYGFSIFTRSCVHIHHCQVQMAGHDVSALLREWSCGHRMP